MSSLVLKICLQLDRVLELLLVLLVTSLILSVSWQVASRYLLQAPSAWTEELARYLLIWIGLLGAAYAYRVRAHMRLEFLEDKLGEKLAARLRALSALAVLVFSFAVMLVGGTRLMLLTLELDQISASLGVPIGLVYLALPLSGLLTVMYALAELTVKEGG